MNSQDTLFVIYLLSIRLATIAAGVIAIRYGYKLFVSAVFKVDTSNKNTLIAGRIGDYELKFSTASPGAVLALFGAIIISLSIAAVPPELKRNQTIKHQNESGKTSTTIQTTESMRGEDISTLQKHLEKANNYKEKQQVANSIREYQQAMRIILKPMSELAELYWKTDKLENAKKLAEVIVLMNPSNHDYSNMLDKINAKLGED